MVRPVLQYHQCDNNSIDNSMYCEQSTASIHNPQKGESEVTKREDEEQQRLELAIMLFQVASYSLIKQCMLDAGFSGKNVVEYDPLYIHFVKCAVSSEFKRIEHLMQVTSKKKTKLSLPQHQNIDLDRKHYDMLQKAVTIFQMKVCSVMKQSMLQAQYPRKQTYECNHNYIAFARLALEKELDRISRFSKQNKVINKPSDSDLLDTDQEPDFCGNNSIAKKSITSDSTEITGSLTGRKRFFERVTAECNSIISNKNTHKSHISTSSSSSSSNTGNNKNNNYNNNVYQNINGNPKSNTPVILNPYYHQHNTTNTNTANNNSMLNQNQPSTTVCRKKILTDSNKKHKKKRKR